MGAASRTMRVTSGKSRVRESRKARICEGRAEWPSYSTTILGAATPSAAPLLLVLRSFSRPPHPRTISCDACWRRRWRASSRAWLPRSAAATPLAAPQRLSARHCDGSHQLGAARGRQGRLRARPARVQASVRVGFRAWHNATASCEPRPSTACSSRRAALFCGRVMGRTRAALFAAQTMPVGDRG
jgi:hypothetical protein